MIFGTQLVSCVKYIFLETTASHVLCLNANLVPTRKNMAHLSKERNLTMNVHANNKFF